MLGAAEVEGALVGAAVDGGDVEVTGLVVAVDGRLVVEGAGRLVVADDGRVVTVDPRVVAGLAGLLGAAG